MDHRSSKRRRLQQQAREDMDVSDSDSNRDRNNDDEDDRKPAATESIEERAENFIKSPTNSNDGETLMKELEQKIEKDNDKLKNDPPNFDLAYNQSLNKTQRGLKDCIDALKKREEEESAKALHRVARVDAFISDDKLQYTADLARFAARIEKLLEWKDSDQVRKNYMAPYFPLIQCSGTGKTKLMYEYAKQTNKSSSEQTKGKNKNSRTCQLILCHRGNPGIDIQASSVFSGDLNVIKDPSADTRTKLWDKLDSYSGGHEEVVLFFDEAQHLLGESGWYFRAIRWWLRKSSRKNNVVAVFAGTTTGMANYYKEPVEPTQFSRDGTEQYLGVGNNLYPPFYEICTIGLFHHTHSDNFVKEKPTRSEFDVAVLYGRPLFARMHLESELHDALSSIMKRMNGEDGTRRDLAVLGTRLQLGQVSFNFASDLVSSGYAHLTHFSPEEYHRTLADIAFLPDPVCARLAMAQMIDRFEIYNKSNPQQSFLKRSIGKDIGEKPEIWAKRAMALYASGLCRPEKGDLGEVASAFYMLVCGDKLRHNQKNKNLTTFSVSLGEWVNEMTGHKTMTNEKNNPSVSFIQVCRNYLRLTMKDIVKNGLLEHWYKSGRAVYAYPMCPGYDVISSVRYYHKGDYKYCPLLVSIKNRGVVSNRDRAIEAMEKIIEEGKFKTGVCILLLIGLDTPKELLLDTQTISPTFEVGKITKLEVVVPSDDEYGATSLSQTSTCGGGERSEVITSHAEGAFIVPPSPHDQNNNNEKSSDDEDYNLPLRKSGDRSSWKLLYSLVNGFNKIRISKGHPPPKR